jgi:hypothetical protein
VPSPPPAATGYWLWSSVNERKERVVKTAAGDLKQGSGDLIVVNPGTPTSPITIESAGQWTLSSYGAVFAFQTNSAGETTSVDERFLVYEKGGRLYRLDLRLGSSTPVATLLSSLVIDQTCPYGNGFEARGAPDWRTPERSLLVFLTPGPDKLCKTSDDALVAVRLDMGPGDAPIPAADIVEAIRNTDGAITGFLIRADTAIQRVDTEFKNPVTLFTVGAAFRVIATTQYTSTGRYLLTFQDGNAVRVYDIASGAGPTTLITLAGGETVDTDTGVGGPLRDNLYLAVNSPTAGRLLRSIEGAAPSVIAQETLPIKMIVPTPTRVIYQTFDPAGVQGSRLRSVAKTGGAPTTLFAAASSEDEQFLVGSIPAVAGENLYFGTYVSPAFSSSRVLMVGSDGANPQMLANALILGGTGRNPARKTFDDEQYYHSILLAVNVGPFMSKPFSNATLRAYDGITRSVLFDYGQLPAGASFTFGAVSPGAPLWGQPALMAIGAGSTTDAFFYQTSAPGLVRVTMFVP